MEFNLPRALEKLFASQDLSERRIKVSYQIKSRFTFVYNWMESGEADFSAPFSEGLTTVH